ncbi:hypothetical protein Rgna01_25790 [Mediterraneibacter gnavus]|uniref:Uncharacterized protein n=1 Tax=Mediterraneibacter gnavus (strain ATCC 29149 / DSM 114966 / JCM 6515 / VPI C7-9) TaxID=411470 RepID=A7B6Y0_MEDG7|nr:hypothetical protein RUMGNA_03344 [Mediterraneibacter gnavus ATCC 29149]GLU96415.1 hypothetical protein Rgna01_25790 [Mediterraneibacter gnavus]
MPSEKRRQGNQVRIPDNARCCIGVVVFHEVTVGNSMGRRNTVFDA